MKMLTPKQLVATWRHNVHKIQVNIENFETLAGRMAVQTFRRSFWAERLNTKGASKWPRRKDNKRHALLREHGTLYRSIKYRELRESRYRGVQVYTDPATFARSPRHPGFVYAAIHNEGGKVAKAGSPARGIAQRQFIGDSSVVMDELEKLTRTVLFRGFPK